MFLKILMWINRILKNFNSKDDAPPPSILISDKMADAINLWSKMYANESPWVDNDNVHSLNLATAIASEYATLITLEMGYTLSGTARAEYLKDRINKVLETIREKVEYGCAYGGIIFKPYVNSKMQICVDYVNTDSFLPISFDDSGNITSIIFYAQITRNNKIFTRLEKHELLSNHQYKITNKAYCSSNKDSLGLPVSLSEIHEWADLAEEATLGNVDVPLFGHFKPAIANNIDTKSSLGVSVFSRAVQIIRRADYLFSGFTWEFEGGEMAIDSADDCLRTIDGEIVEMPKKRKRLFRRVGSRDPDFYKVFSPELRDASYKNGLNMLYQRIEFLCGLAYGTISDPQNVDKTAEEIRTSKQRSYANVTANQKALTTALTSLIHAIDIYASLYNLAPSGEYDIKFDYQDSILTDPDKEQAIRFLEVQSGVTTKESYLKWRYKLTDEGVKEIINAESVNENPFNFEDE